MPKNKIVEIAVDCIEYPFVQVWREEEDGWNHTKYYPADRKDNSFNGRRFVRGIQMVAELYRRQADASH